VERCWGILQQHWNGAKLVDAQTIPMRSSPAGTCAISRQGSFRSWRRRD
jgi:hypothetical protein